MKNLKKRRTHHRTKRFFAMLLAGLLTFQLVPTGAFAYGSVAIDPLSNESIALEEESSTLPASESEQSDEPTEAAYEEAAQEAPLQTDSIAEAVSEEHTQEAPTQSGESNEVASEEGAQGATQESDGSPNAIFDEDASEASSLTDTNQQGSQSGDAVVAQGFVTLYGVSVAAFELELLVNGVPTGNYNLLFEYSEERSQGSANGQVWSFSFRGSPEGNSPAPHQVYTVRAKATHQVGTPPSFMQYFVWGGQIIGEGNNPGGRPADIVLVDLESFVFEYVLNTANADAPKSTVAALSAIDGTDGSFTISQKYIALESGSQFSVTEELPSYHPLTGNKITYAAQITDNDAGYVVHYQNTEPNADTFDKVFSGGTIINSPLSAEVDVTEDDAPEADAPEAALASETKEESDKVLAEDNEVTNDESSESGGFFAAISDFFSSLFGITTDEQPDSEPELESETGFSLVTKDTIDLDISILWQDDSNSAGKRPASNQVAIGLTYSLDGGLSFRELTQEVLKNWGVEQTFTGILPREEDSRAWSYSYKGLPETLLTYQWAKGQEELDGEIVSVESNRLVSSTPITYAFEQIVSLESFSEDYSTELLTSNQEALIAINTLIAYEPLAAGEPIDEPLDGPLAIDEPFALAQPLAEPLAFQSFNEISPMNDDVDYIYVGGKLNLMGLDLATFQSQYTIELYENGVLLSGATAILNGPLGTYSFGELPTVDASGQLEYTVRVAKTIYNALDTKQFYYSGGVLVGDGSTPLLVPVDITLVSLVDFHATYVIDADPDNEGEIPSGTPAGVKVELSTLEAAHSGYLPTTTTTILGPLSKEVSFKDLLSHNPETGEEIIYRVQIIEDNAPGYEVSYTNVAEGFEEETGYAYTGGTITNTYVEKLTVGFTAGTDYIFTINWIDNDGADGHRPLPADVDIEIYFTLEGEDEPRLLTPEVLSEWAELGIDIGPTLTNTGRIWRYDFSLPASFNKVNEYGELVESLKLSYTFAQVIDDPVFKQHYLTEQTGPLSVNNTLNVVYTAEIAWKDALNKNNTRLGEDDIKPNLMLYRIYTEGANTHEEVVGLLSELGDMVQIDTSGANWQLEISGLPHFHPNHLLYTYYVKAVDSTMDLAEYNSLPNDSSAEYASSYRNKGNFVQNSQAAYEGGTILFTLSDTANFNMTKVWQDDGTETRPGGTLTLYRYPDVPGRSFTTAIPVSGLSMPLASYPSGGEYSIDFSTLASYPKDGLPRFDNEGNEYIYFVREVLSGAGTDNYSQIFSYPEGMSGLGGSVLYNGGTLQNRRIGTVEQTVNKTWYAQAVPSMDASVTIVAERKISGTDGAWEEASSQTMSGFGAATTQQSCSFSLPEYSEEGLLYEYRFREASVTVNGATVDLGAEELEAGNDSQEYSIAPFSYRATYTTNSNGDVFISNSLIGQTEVYVRKIWTDNNPQNLTLYINSDRAASVSKPFTTEQQALEGFYYLGSFDRFDQMGRIIRYDITEATPAANQETAPLGYSVGYTNNRTTDTDINGVEYGILQTTITNTPIVNTSDARYVIAQKVWADDGDEACRGNVVVQLYAKDKVKGDETGEWEWTGNWTLVQGATATLTYGNDWRAWIRIDDYARTTWGATSGSQALYSDFMLREVSMVSEGTTYAVDFLDPTITALVPGASSMPMGTVTTNEHSYSSWAQLNSDGRNYTFRNVREGTVNIDLAKTWIDDDHHTVVSQALTIEITRRQANSTEESLYQTIILDGTEDKPWTKRLEGLPKYDTNGVLYYYYAYETAITETETGTVHPLGRGGSSYELDDRHLYTVSSEERRIYGEHMPGLTAPQPDEYSFGFTNQRSETINFVAYKIWRDVLRTDGTDESASENALRQRPDFYFQLFQYADGMETPLDVQANWTTSGDDFNDYAWQCIYDGLPRYDEGGKEIIYYVKEIMDYPGEYESTYFNSGEPYNSTLLSDNLQELTVPSLEAVAPGVTMYKSTGFETSDGYIHFGGSVENLRVGERRMSGQKVWKNVPAGISGSDLPSVNLQLKVYTWDDPLGDFLYSATGEAVVTLERNKRDFIFVDANQNVVSLDKYDRYGVFIRYMAVEVIQEGNEDNYVEIIGGPDGNVTAGYLEPSYDSFTMTVTNSYKTIDDLTDDDLVSVSVNKDWVNMRQDLSPGLYPRASIELWRVATDEDGNDLVGSGLIGAELVDASWVKVVEGGSFANPQQITYDPNGLGQSIVFSGLPKYAYNGNPFRYFVMEAPLAGYEASVQEDDAASQGNSFAYTIVNTYTGIDEESVSITGSKIWSDQSNGFSTRPGAPEFEGSFKVYRQAEGHGASLEDITSAVTLDWNMSAQNTWTFEIHTRQDGVGISSQMTGAEQSGGLYRYAHDGSSYLYYVVELPTSRSYHYTSVISANGGSSALIGAGELPLGSLVAKTRSISDTAEWASFTNTLRTSSVSTTKSWLTQEFEGLISGPINLLQLEMLLPSEIIFGVEYYDAAAEAWLPLMETVGEISSQKQTRIPKSQLITILRGASSNVMTVLINNLPLYGSSASDTRAYRLVETSINGVPVPWHATQPVDAQGQFVVSGNGSGAISNTLETIPLTIHKSWDDEDNRDGVRPASISFTIVDDADVTRRIAVVMTPDRNPITVQVPRYNAQNKLAEYTVTESFVIPNTGFIARYELFDSNGNLRGSLNSSGAITGSLSLPDPGLDASSAPLAKEYEFTNRHVPRTINVSATKQRWDDLYINQSFGSSEVRNIRPTSIYFTLQWFQGNRWEVVPSHILDGQAAIVEMKPEDEYDTGWFWATTWNDLPARMNDGTTNASMERIRYRVIETAKSPLDPSNIDYLAERVIGYSAGYRDAAVGGSYSASNMPIWVDDTSCNASNTARIQISNLMDSTSILIQKRWLGLDGVEYAEIPPSVTVLLQYRLEQAGQAEENPWLDAIRTVTISGSSDEHIWNGVIEYLPVVNNQGVRYEYKIKEIKIGDVDVVESEAGIEAVGYIVVNGNDVGTTSTPAFVSNTFQSHGSITVKKNWEDAGNQDGLRPESVIFGLSRVVGTTKELLDTVPVSAEDSWSHTWANLPQYRLDGSEAVYEVEELSLGNNADVQGIIERIDRYTAEYNYTDTSGALIENSSDPAQVKVNNSAPARIFVDNHYTPLVMDLRPTKSWIDFDNAYGLQPESVQVKISAKVDGATVPMTELMGLDFVDTLTLDASGSWNQAWTDLPVYWDNGTEVVYTVTEIGSSGLDTAFHGYNPPGYSYSAGGYGIARSNGVGGNIDDKPNTEASVTVSNEIETIDVPVRKVLNTEGGSFFDLPSEVSFELYQRPVDST
ncbi:MAG: Cna B-type domain-containing protein, partial [Coriobacteriia bacterium]|nr:Cna B-type domain-containing protein [Coriobacteriia bacterium]